MIEVVLCYGTEDMRKKGFKETSLGPYQSISFVYNSWVNLQTLSGDLEQLEREHDGYIFYKGHYYSDVHVKPFENKEVHNSA